MRGTKRVALTMLLIATLISSVMVINSTAATIIGEFEIDGNIPDSAPGVPYDWDTLPGAVVFPDPEVPALSGCPAGEDDSFGGSSDEETPSGWKFVCQNVPPKDDFTEGGIGSRKIGTDNWLYLYFIRASSSGSAAQNYEFNRDPGTFDNDNNPATPEIPIRTAGDILINLEVANGGAQTTIQVFSWDGDRNSGNWVVVPSNPVRGTDWEVATDAGSNGKFKFAELAIRLQAFGVFPSCPGLGKAWMKSNSTFDIEGGTLKDHSVRKDVNLSDCAIKDWSFTLSPTGIAGVTVKAVYTVEGGETRTLTLTDPEGDGTYTATDGQIPPGTVSFHFEVLNGDALIYASPEDTESFVEGERKLNEGELGFAIDLSPGAENFVGNAHVFTATVTNSATGDPLPNVPVNFALSEGVPQGCGTIDPTSGVTDANGQVSTTVNSATPCTTDVVAWINGTQPDATASFDSGEAVDVSTKLFVDYELTVTPESVTNEVGDDHTFTVLLTKDDHGAPAPFDGATIDLELLPLDGPAHFTEINGQPASGTTATCVTQQDDPETDVDETGTCSVTIDSDTPGAFTLHASFEATDDSGEIRIFEDSGSKQFINVTLDVTPDEAENDAATDLTHEFTVTLKHDEGSGLVPFPGQTVSLTLDPGTTGATITSIVTGDIGDPPVTGTCTTDANGQCVVTITATSAGTATLTATWSQELSGGGTITRSDTATKVFSDFDLDVTPDEAENDVDTDLEHEFTVTLTKNGAAFPDQTVTFVLDPGSTGATITSIVTGDIGDPPVTGSCTTDVNGQCFVTITATSPGTATLTATFTDELTGGATVTRSDTATKVFSDFAIDVTPDEADNDVDVDLTHEFTVTLTRNDGNGFAPYPNQTVSLSLNPGNTGATITSIVTGDIGDPPVTGTCTTDVNGQCFVTITATSPGTASLTATFNGDLVGGGTVTRSDTATKSFLDFDLQVTPEKAFNRVGDPHTFDVLLTQDTGSGPVGYGGQTVHLSLDAGDTDAHFTSINGEDAEGVEADCTTTLDDPETPADEGGHCFVVITSSSAGSVTLTATWEQEVGGATSTRTDTAEKIFLAIDLTKTACPADTSPRGGIVDYTIAFSIGGSSLTNATVVDDLPATVELVEASPIGGVEPTVEGGDVTWSFPTLAAGSYTGSIRVRVLEDVDNGTQITNEVTLDADEIEPETATQTLVVSDEGRSGSSRAYGIRLDLLGSELIPPTPDSDEIGSGEVLAIPDPFGSDTPLLKLLSVSESDDSTADQEAHSATATALGVDLNVPGVLHLKADTVVAKTSSHATATSAGSTRAGSLIQGLVINEVNYGVVSEPTTILVRDPLSGDVLAEVHLLETGRSGAAGGQEMPNANNEFASGIAVNGIHVKVHLLDLVDLVVSHSESQAEFPSGLGCGEDIPAVSGSGYALGINLKPDSEDGIDLGSVKVAEVNLPITGGSDIASLADVVVPDVVAASVARAETEGEITDENGNGVPIEASTKAHVADVNLLDGTIVARAVTATSHSEAEKVSEGTTEILGLEIGGTDVCEALGLSSLCKPEPNTELLIPGGPILVMLNEQIPEPGGLTVNAVHIWILGKGNPFGLPVGADIVIANAHSDAHPAGPIVVEDDTPVVLNAKALSAPSAQKLVKRVADVPDTYELPVAVPLGAPVDAVSVPEIVQDPVGVIEDLTDLALPEEVLDDATQLVETLTDPEALLEALADPATLFEGLTDPAAAIEALAEATGVVIEEPASEETASAELTPEQLTERLLRLVGL